VSWAARPIDLASLIGITDLRVSLLLRNAAHPAAGIEPQRWWWHGVCLLDQHRGIQYSKKVGFTELGLRSLDDLHGCGAWGVMKRPDERREHPPNAQTADQRWTLPGA